jgi:hypothetical protein
MSTFIYFAQFLILVPLASLLENTLVEWSNLNSSNFKNSPILNKFLTKRFK